MAIQGLTDEHRLEILARHASIHREACNKTAKPEKTYTVRLDFEDYASKVGAMIKEAVQPIIDENKALRAEIVMLKSK